MKLQQEVRHKSEDVQDDVLLDAVRAIGRRVRVVNRDYDILYIAGYSDDGETIYIDRHLPRTLRSWTRKIRVTAFPPKRCARLGSAWSSTRPPTS